MNTEIPNMHCLPDSEVIAKQPVDLSLALDACQEAWNAFDNGKRKHHRDALSGKCIEGCQACAIEKLRRVLGKPAAEKGSQ